MVLVPRGGSFLESLSTVRLVAIPFFLILAVKEYHPRPATNKSETNTEVKDHNLTNSDAKSLEICHPYVL